MTKRSHQYMNMSIGGCAVQAQVNAMLVLSARYDETLGIGQQAATLLLMQDCGHYAEYKYALGHKH